MITLFHLTFSGKENDPIDDDKIKNIDQKFYGPATSCDELGILGYTLNGFYIVKAKAQTTSSRFQFEIVYCQFYHPLGLRHQGTKKGKGTYSLRILFFLR